MKEKGRYTTLILIGAFFIGLFLLLYPSVANYWNAIHQTHVINEYQENITGISEETYANYFYEATDFNDRISARDDQLFMSDEEMAEYNELLNVLGTGVMGVIEIPSIDVTLPVCHGTSDNVLQTSVGHLEWSSLPVGGPGTHCVLSGHRGLPSAQLFTHLDKLDKGDIFMLKVLNEVMTYEVDQVMIVNPEDVEELVLREGKDYCTLVTCTPYGINTHRLLVRGHRIANTEKAISIQITADAVKIDPVLIVSGAGVPALVILMIIVLAAGGFDKLGRKARGKNQKRA